MQKQKIVISGAGIGGLTTALSLIDKGFEVLILEQAAELKEVGAGLQLSPNVLRVLYRLGLEQALLKVVSEPLGKEIRLWNTGQSWQLFEVDEGYRARYGYPYFMIYRPDLHQVLYDAVQNRQSEAVLLGTKVTRVESVANGVQVHTQQGGIFQGAALVAADGVHSIIRNQLFGDDRPQFSGCMAWRGVIPSALLPARLRHNAGVNWVGPGAHVINYPLRRGELMNFVGIVERDDWLTESWHAEGSHEECLHDFLGWHEDVHTMIQNIETPFKWALMSRPALTSWVKGRVALLGDAAHPTLPFLAQGAAMAIEDGYVLAQALSTIASVPAALQAYQEARIERCTKIVEGSAANGRRFHNQQLRNEAQASAYVQKEWSKKKIAARYEWIFSYQADQAIT